MLNTNITPIEAKPFLKWAGGKTQLLNELKDRAPTKFNRYIEPFIGGGAMFFATLPNKAVIADANSNLINAYQCIANNVEQVIEYLQTFKNTELYFKEMRELDPTNLDKEYAAARMIYLNKTCYNGLYRVNQKDKFNTAYGHYKKPNFCAKETLRIASRALQNVDIICGDYKDVLAKFAQVGDFVFLDPPYLPISESTNFVQYTKEGFYEQQHIELANEVHRLQEIGCYVILTTSNHHLSYILYEPYKIELKSIRRGMSLRAENRKSEDLIITAQPSSIVWC